MIAKAPPAATKRPRQSLLLLVTGATAALLAGCAEKADKPFCSKGGCELTEWEWEQLSELANLPEAPPLDRTNKFCGHPGAEALGQMFFFETRFSGPSTQQDSLRRPTAYGRAPRGQATNISCNSCHDTHRGGVDATSIPGNVSVGSGWADTNALPVFNAAFYGIQYWSGRADSMWSQGISSSEGNNMNGNRLATAWLIHEKYRATWDAVFGEYPFPLAGKSADIAATLETTGALAGQCKLVAGACPATCRATPGDNGATGCWPRFPLNGRLGTKKGCQPADAAEPFGDAFDCMDAEDQKTITRVLVNWAKALAAYEYKLVSRDSAFDRFVNEVTAHGKSSAISAEAQRGAKLFVGKAACNDCHNTPLFSDSEFYNVGIAQVGPGVPQEADCPDGSVCDCVVNPEPGKDDPMSGVKNCLPWGARTGIVRLRAGEFLRSSPHSDDPTDTSRKRYVDMSMQSLAIGAWRTPSLRDVAITAPYMHNGSIATLEDVIRHYNAGGSPNGTGQRSPRIKPLGLTEAEVHDLVAFLKTLNGAPLPAALVDAPALPQ